MHEFGAPTIDMSIFKDKDYCGCSTSQCCSANASAFGTLSSLRLPARQHWTNRWGTVEPIDIAMMNKGYILIYFILPLTKPKM